MKKQILTDESTLVLFIVPALSGTAKLFCSAGNRCLKAVVFAAGLLAIAGSSLAGSPMSPAFTYQGRLYDNGSASSGSYDFRFFLMAGVNMPVSACPDPLILRDVPVTNGVFTVSLPFCAEAFDGTDRWLQIAVSPRGAETYSTLDPMQKITATPYAIHSDTARAAATAVQADTATRALNLDAAARVPWSSISDPPAALGSTYTPGEGLRLDEHIFSLDDASRSGARYDGRFWKLGGNGSVPSGVSPSIGTVLGSLQPMELMANGQRVLRIEAKGARPNLIGGYSGNFAVDDAVGATVSGGGDNYYTDFWGFLVDRRNRVTDDYGAVGGGRANQAGNYAGSLSDAAYATVGGGDFNKAAGLAATVPGGQRNLAGGDFSLAAGRRARAMHTGSFVWADSTDADYVSGANNQFSIRANGGIRLDGNTSINGMFSMNGDAALNGDVYALDHDLRLRSFGDINHGVGYRSSLGGSVLDGPFLYGNLGGALGTRAGDTVALKWNDAGDVAVSHNLSTATLTIRGGADLAEPFKMSGKEIPQGAVVVIDEENPGQLKMSSRAYDTQVAGIVSGANGVNPGISLSQEGVLEGGQNVALTGRVYVQADATFGPIKPGDLLTTSYTPGHAMKVSNHAKAQGAILGKAMTTLKQGKGMVLVLVTLQ